MSPEIKINTKTNVSDNRFRLEYTSAADNLSDWAIVQPGTSRDWIVVLHGHGSDGTQIFTRPDIRDTRLPVFMEFGCGIYSPNLRGNAWMCPEAAADLHSSLKFIKAEYHVERFFFISGSMGGTGNLIYSVLHPEDVAGVIALCPASDLCSYHNWCCNNSEGVRGEIRDAIESSYGGKPDDKSLIYKKHSAQENSHKLTMPVAVVHGDCDPTIPVEQSRELAAKMDGRDNFSYLELKGARHDFPQDEVLVLIRKMLS